MAFTREHAVDARRRTEGSPERPAQPLNSLVAAAKTISGRKMKRAQPEGWQDEAWDLYDEVGELRFVANNLANAMSRTRLFAAKLPLGDDEPTPIDPDSTDQEVTADDEQAAAVVQAIGGGALGRAELIRRLAVQLFVPGDGYLVGLPAGVLDAAEPRPDTDPAGVLPPDGQVAIEDLTWHCLSINEVAVRGSRIALNIGDEAREVDADKAVLIRVWRPHPRRWWAADSPVRANLGVLRELVGLTKHVGASIDSRLAGAGLLALPEQVEVMGSATEGGDTPDDADEQDPFTSALMETMTIPIRDRDSAAAVVPLVVKVPTDAVDKIRHITFTTPFDTAAKDLREEAIRRLALGLDAPPEVLTGLGSTNHWSAWQIEESTVKVHVEPVLALICDAITTEYLWPVLEEARVPNARDYVVWFDTTDLTLRPNKTTEAQALYDAGELTGEALRRESGFGEDDRPAQPDRAVEIALGMVRSEPGLIVEPGLPAIIDTIRAAIAEGQEVEGGEPAAEATGDGATGEGADTGMELPDTQAEPPPAAVASGNGHRG